MELWRSYRHITLSLLSRAKHCFFLMKFKRVPKQKVKVCPMYAVKTIIHWNSVRPGFSASCYRQLNPCRNHRLPARTWPQNGQPVLHPEICIKSLSHARTLLNSPTQAKLKSVEELAKCKFQLMNDAIEFITICIATCYLISHQLSIINGRCQTSSFAWGSVVFLIKHLHRTSLLLFSVLRRDSLKARL